MSMKPGETVRPVRVDDPARADRGVGEVADGPYRLACDPDIGGEARRSGAVDHRAARYQYVEHVCLQLRAIGMRRKRQ